MPKFLLAYHGGKSFETREEGAAHMSKWNAWNDGLGDAVLDPGMYIGSSKTISAEGIVDGGGVNPLSGITVLQANSMDEAVAMATACPHIGIGGTIEVAQVMDM